MNKLHVIGGFLALCAVVACHPIGPPDNNRSAHRPIPGAPQTEPATAKPAVSAATAQSPGVSAAASPAPLNRPAQASTRPGSAPTPPRQASKPATPNDPYLTATKAPGRPGYVLSPHTGKLVLVDGIPRGVVVPDQTCPPGEKKFFRVP